MNSRRIGNRGEQKAVEYLKEAGFFIIDRNIVLDHAEIDIIAKDGNELVFVEVKYRRGRGYGEGDESISNSKIRALGRAAELWMYKHRQEDIFARFDVISIMDEPNKETKLIHHKDAITLFN